MLTLNYGGIYFPDWIKSSNIFLAESVANYHTTINTLCLIQTLEMVDCRKKLLSIGVKIKIGSEEG